MATGSGQSRGRAVPRFAAVRAAFAEVLAAYPGGGAVAVYEHGRPVVDLHGGVGVADGRPWQGDSLVMTASCTKGVTTICALVLVERGLLDLDAPVARYWPQFAEAGKASIPVRWLLTHQAGLASFPPSAGVRMADLLDWARVTGVLAAQEPLWEPGAFSGYHALTFGYLVGELIRRVSGRTPGEFLAREVAGPLGAEFWIGLPAEHEARVVPHAAPSAPEPPVDLRALFAERGLDPDTPLAAAMAAAADDGPAAPAWNTRPFRAAEIPAANGIGSARGLARLYAACVGAVDGVRLLSPSTVDAARTPRTTGVPAPPELAVITANPPVFGLGFQVPRADVDIMLGPGSFGHTGAGGRLAFAHPERGIAFAFVCDAMLWDGLTGPDPRWPALLTALAAAAVG